MTEERGSLKSLFSIAKNGDFFGTYLGESKAASAVETLTRIPAGAEHGLVSKLSDLAIGEKMNVGYGFVVTRIKPVVFPGGRISLYE